MYAETVLCVWLVLSYEHGVGTCTCLWMHYTQRFVILPFPIQIWTIPQQHLPNIILPLSTKSAETILFHFHFVTELYNSANQSTPQHRVVVPQTPYIRKYLSHLESQLVPG